MEGTVSFSETGTIQMPVHVLRDTGAAQTFILESLLPFSDHSFCGSKMLVQGIEPSVVKAPLHIVYLKLEVISGLVRVAVRPEFPIKGVSFILGNDLAVGKVFPLLEVTDTPKSSSDALAHTFPNVFYSMCGNTVTSSQVWQCSGSPGNLLVPTVQQLSLNL